MFDRVAEAGDTGGNGDETYSPSAEDRLQRIAETAAKNIAFNEGISVERNADRLRIFLNVRQRLMEFRHCRAIAAVVFNTCNARAAGLFYKLYDGVLLRHQRVFECDFDAVNLFQFDIGKQIDFFKSERLKGELGNY